MHRVVALVLLMACCVDADGEARFSGIGRLVPAPMQSVDRRFELAAKLRPGRPPASTQHRFTVDARLHAAGAASVAKAACAVATNEVFGDGFE